MKKSALLVFLFLYLGSSAVSFGVFSVFGKTQTAPAGVGDPITVGESEASDEESLLAIAPGEPKDQPCPLTGQLFTQTERDSWEKRRPAAVMIENHPEARPQSGLSNADVVFEALAEGGVTRFMGIFYCGAQNKDIKLAPVRSARTYFVDWASGFNRPLYVHVGGANLPGPSNALGQLKEYGWHLNNDIDAMSTSYPTFVRDYSRLGADKQLDTEHTMVSSTEKLWTLAEKRKWTGTSPATTIGKKTTPSASWASGFTPWEFADGAAAGSPTAKKISYEFWDGFSEYAVRWEYDAASNSYKRFLANQPHTDLNTNEQIAVKNAVVIFTEEKGPINENKHMLYKTTGTGDAVIFQNGQEVKAKWSKKDREAPLLFTDTKGKAITFVRGPIWISNVALKTAVAVE
jgi:hypothetical protein